MDKQRKLTAKQTEIMNRLKQVGSLFTGCYGDEYRTLESLRKRGLVEADAVTYYGKTYRLAEVQA